MLLGPALEIKYIMYDNEYIFNNFPVLGSVKYILSYMKCLMLGNPEKADPQTCLCSGFHVAED